MFADSGDSFTPTTMSVLVSIQYTDKIRGCCDIVIRIA